MAKRRQAEGFHDRPIFTLVGEDLITVAKDLGVPDKELDEELFHEVQKGVEAGFGNCTRSWRTPSRWPWTSAATEP